MIGISFNCCTIQCTFYYVYAPMIGLVPEIRHNRYASNNDNKKGCTCTFHFMLSYQTIKMPLGSLYSKPLGIVGFVR